MRDGRHPTGISIVANNVRADHEGLKDHSEVGLGAPLAGVGGLLAGLGLLAILGLGPIMTAGWFAATAVRAGVGAVGSAPRVASSKL